MEIHRAPAHFKRGDKEQENGEGGKTACVNEGQQVMSWFGVKKEEGGCNEIRATKF